jgi:hydrogenase maturation protease
MSGRAAVFGLGNVLLHDDAFGPEVVRELLARWAFPEEVFVDDLGTPGLELSTHLPGYECVILVDAVAAALPVGSIVSYDQPAILTHPTGIKLGPHDPSLAETVQTMSLIDDGPGEIVLMGAVPESTQPGIGMCEAMRNAVPSVAMMVVDELARRGFPPSPREGGRPSVAWWESSPDEAAWRVCSGASDD